MWLKYLNVVPILGVLVALAYIALESASIAGIFTSVRGYFENLSNTQPEAGMKRLVQEYRKGCPNHRFKSTQLLSRDPDIVLIEGFLTQAEAQFLVKAA